MFDTIKISMKDVRVNVSQVGWSRRQVISQGEDEFEYCQLYEGNGAPRIRFSPRTQYLSVEVSLPVFMFGHNVKMISKADIPIALAKLHIYVAKVLNHSLDELPLIDKWHVCRLDVCCNFQVGEIVKDYIRHASKISIPHYDKRIYNDYETVEWKSKSKVLILYFKEGEVIVKYKGQDKLTELIELSKGILRVEVRLSSRDIYLISSSRKVGDILLAESAFEHIQKALFKLGLDKFKESVESIFGLLQAKGVSVSKAERLTKFLERIQQNGEEDTRQLYGVRNYRRYQQTLRELGVSTSYITISLNSLEAPEAWSNQPQNEERATKTPLMSRSSNE